MSHDLQDKAWYEATVFGFISRQFTKPKPLPAGISLANQVAIVTGSNVGLGFSAARQLLQRGLSHLVMGVRSQARGDEAAERLRSEFPKAIISVWVVDLESYASVSAFTEQCATLPRIDLAILNAGLMKSSHTIINSTGHEATLQVNYLSTALLALLLVPVLKGKKAQGKSRPPVLSLIGSDLVYDASLDGEGPVLSQLDRSAGFDAFAWYSKSKLLQLMFASKLAEHVSPDDVLINVANPGMTRDTSFFRESSAIQVVLMGIAQRLFARSVDVAATIYLDATLVQDKRSHGSFLSDWAIKPYPKILYKAEGLKLRSNLWDETIAELSSVGASKVIKDLGPQ
ncbi:Short chain dehydrogenase virL [Paramyrothecium foliicola]|nr:Short chain dehydrogenase virL [Paramyrothecium foliicola]